MTFKVFDDFDECLAEYERVRPWVLNTLFYENTGMTEREVMEAIGRRKMVLVSIDTAYALISFVQSEDHSVFDSAFGIEDEGKFVLLHLIGGQMNESLGAIFAEMEAFEKYVLSKGYRRIVAIGRKGWKRVVEANGFETKPHNEFENTYSKEVQ
jgi:hypothetical protein